MSRHSVRTGAIVLLGACLLVPGTALSDTVRQSADRAAALVRPILDGSGLGGLRLGQDERLVTRVLGTPRSIEPSNLGERALSYEVAPGVRLEAHVGGGTIQAIGLVATGPAPARSPQTARGIALGAPVASVEERYGRPESAGLWYAAEGIAFNVAGPSFTVQSIVVIPRGTTAP